MSRTTQVPSGDWRGFRLRGCHPLRPGFPAGSANLASSRCRRRAWAGICPWARLIAACHVLLRLREPRHPSCALFSFPCVFRPAESRLPFPLSDSVEPDRVSWSNFPGGCRAAGGLVCLDSLICSFVSRRLIRLGFQYVNVLFFRVENNGFEPLTPCLQSRCSSQLS